MSKTRKGLAVCLLVAACAMSMGVIQGQGRVDRDIVYGEEAGACVLTSSPTQIRAQAQFIIVWRVKNNCGQAIDVSVGNFRLNGEDNEPLTLTGTASVPAGKQGLITGLVKDEAAVGTYTYDVKEGKETADPELVIDPRR